MAMDEGMLTLRHASLVSAAQDSTPLPQPQQQQQHANTLSQESTFTPVPDLVPVPSLSGGFVGLVGPNHTVVVPLPAS